MVSAALRRDRPQAHSPDGPTASERPAEVARLRRASAVAVCWRPLPPVVTRAKHAPSDCEEDRHDARVPRISAVDGGRRHPPGPRARRQRAELSPRPVRMILGFPAGGSTDLVARIMAAWLTERL